MPAKTTAAITADAEDRSPHPVAPQPSVGRTKRSDVATCRRTTAVTNGQDHAQRSVIDNQWCRDSLEWMSHGWLNYHY
jgi:hypothetical protein